MRTDFRSEKHEEHMAGQDSIRSNKQCNLVFGAFRCLMWNFEVTCIPILVQEFPPGCDSKSVHVITEAF